MTRAKSDPAPSSTDVRRIERYEVAGDRLLRRISRHDGTVQKTDMGDAPGAIRSPAKLHALADRRFLRLEEPPAHPAQGPSVKIADLFGGIGALSLGAFEASRAVGRQAELVLAADSDPAPLAVLRETFDVDEGVAREIDLGAVLSSRAGGRTKAEREWLGDERRDLDILLAGPPCQGHSPLNNHTRHDDPRNDLYGKVGRFIELEMPRLCLIENVESVVNDQRQIASGTAKLLKRLGYQVDEGSVALHELGVPQKRRRHILVATREGERQLKVKEVVGAYAVEGSEARNLSWAIRDLEGRKESEGFDAPSTPSKDNEARIRWLHGSEKRVDLPNSRRPTCHKEPKPDDDGVKREHSYKSMYGKLDWGKPAQTITSGYGSMGQGRYVHPSRPRTLTPHEAARLQFIPDFVRFDAVEGRGKWARMIGNVAPMKLSYVFALEFLR
jgi:DNA (cytosine-5)-methyltransferase 1